MTFSLKLCQQLKGIFTELLQFKLGEWCHLWLFRSVTRSSLLLLLLELLLLLLLLLLIDHDIGRSLSVILLLRLYATNIVSDLILRHFIDIIGHSWCNWLSSITRSELLLLKLLLLKDLRM
ncbi:hypothetical protein WICPIJ_004613 [Wickerhamomyces pijperi]|uniref:Uncharacterized protein n=1 Tax=Wickerhamomyces pijperi TaxID=599730 RepID=A0A9P8Q5L6_WICPI|nr:hypothetical protein WICPIJ_004613 [Wickerhamomyces pijperi]